MEEGKGRQDIALLTNSVFPLLLRSQTTRLKRGGRQCLSSKRFLLSTLWLSLCRPHLHMFVAKSCCFLQLWVGGWVGWQGSKVRSFVCMFGNINDPHVDKSVGEQSVKPLNVVQHRRNCLLHFRPPDYSAKVTPASPARSFAPADPFFFSSLSSSCDFSSAAFFLSCYKSIDC